MAWAATVGLDSRGYGELQCNPGICLKWIPLNHLLSKRLLRLREQGKKFIIIDPRKTPATKKLADIHLQISLNRRGPCLGMANLIIQNNWHDKEYIEKYTYGFEEYAEYVSQFDLATARLTGLKEEDI